MLDPFVLAAPLLLLPVVGLLRFIGCGTLLELSEDPAPPPTLTVDPASIDLGPGAKKQFTAKEPNGSPVLIPNWSADLGTIGFDGIYAAPDPFALASPPVPGSNRKATVTVTNNTGLKGTAVVNLTHVTGVTVSPASVTLAPGQPQPFTASVQGTPDQKVAWSIAPATGTIDAAGHYTAPVIYVSGSPPVTVLATSQADFDPLVLPGKATVNLISGNSATFVASDTATRGDWNGIYGSPPGGGYALAGKPTNFVTSPPAPYLPSLNLASLSLATSFGDPTADARGLKKPPTFATRFADMWSEPGSITLDLQFNDFAPHQVAIYCVDWDTVLRKQKVEILDPSQVPPAVLDTQNLSLFNSGQYLIWKLSGHVILRITKTGSGSAVLSGIFFQ